MLRRTLPVLMLVLRAADLQHERGVFFILSCISTTLATRCITVRHILAAKDAAIKHALQGCKRSRRTSCCPACRRTQRMASGQSWGRRWIFKLPIVQEADYEKHGARHLKRFRCSTPAEPPRMSKDQKEAAPSVMVAWKLRSVGTQLRRSAALSRSSPSATLTTRLIPSPLPWH